MMKIFVTRKLLSALSSLFVVRLRGINEKHVIFGITASFPLHIARKKYFDLYAKSRMTAKGKTVAIKMPIYARRKIKCSHKINSVSNNT